MFINIVDSKRIEVKLVIISCFRSILSFFSIKYGKSWFGSIWERIINAFISCLLFTFES